MTIYDEIKEIDAEIAKHHQRSRQELDDADLHIVRESKAVAEVGAALSRLAVEVSEATKRHGEELRSVALTTLTEVADASASESSRLDDWIASYCHQQSVAGTAMNRLVAMHQRAVAALDSLASARRARIRMASTSAAALSELSARRAEALSRFEEKRHANARPIGSGAPTASANPGRVDPLNWDDLPAYLGSQAATGRRSRDCPTCGGPVSNGRKRFCSRDCHVAHREIYGTALLPRNRMVSDEEPY